jgi:excisionase family DNA binding protein
MFKDYPDVVTVEQLAEMLNIGKSSAYSLLQNNQIRHVKVGKKYIIPKTAVLDFIGEMCYNSNKIINGRLTKSVIHERGVDI